MNFHIIVDVTDESSMRQLQYYTGYTYTAI